MTSKGNATDIILKCTLFISFSFITHFISGQISYGGRPLPLQSGMTARSATPTVDLFVEMPSFDVQAAMWRSQQDKAQFKSLEFAHKFFVHLRPNNSGISFTEGNMKVWRVGIRSKGAYSLNILFSTFRLPNGAKLYVYNNDQTEVLGSFTSDNNTDLNLLPLQPIGGEELIVEYQEPLNAEFEGEIEIGEVNHDYVGIFRAAEPRDPVNSCHPNLVCYPEDILPGSGVVALIINGTTYCTGSLINNTANDGTPYLITATHCLNNDYNASFLANRKYDLVAGRIVAFFNYNSPVCETDIRGPLQMSLASADSVLISERHDISLLKFKQAPPKEYQPYYLGWNASPTYSAPFHGIHHPNGGIKKVAVEEGSLSIGSFSDPRYNMEPNSFLLVRDWDIATTEGGSSGSPLLDREKRIIGTLTGGVSQCSSPRGPDYYASVQRFWQVESSLNNPNSIRYYLDPQDSQVTQIDGYNPFVSEPFSKSSNFKADEKPIVTYFQSVPMFATNNTFGYTEFAEEFHAKTSTQLQGVFISSPSTNNASNLNVRIRIYTGSEGPTKLVYEQPFDYSYRYYSNNNFSQSQRDMKHSVENYIRFTTPVTVTGSFYISYTDANGVPSGFSVFNTTPRKLGSGIKSTAWMRNTTGWVRSSENIEYPINTALLIIPYVIGSGSTEVEPIPEKAETKVYFSNDVKRIFIESNQELLQWEIYYSSGLKIHQESTDKSINRASYPAANLPGGVYIVKVKTVQGDVSTKKVLVL